MTPRAVVVLSGALFACSTSPPPAAPPAAVANARAGVEAFNRAMTDAMRTMNDATTLSLWEDDGVSLLPGSPPIVGKKAIAAMIADVEAKNPALRMQTFDMQCSGIETSGDLAHEYCDEHQVVDLGPGKQPFDGRGRILFVLHRGTDGVWRLRREVFQSMKD